MPDCAIICTTNDAIRLTDPSGAIARRYKPFLMNRVVQQQKTLLQCKGAYWVGPLAKERSAFVSYVYKKWDQDKVFRFLDELETSVPSFEKDFYFLKENFNPIIGFIRNYLKKSEDPKTALSLGLSTRLRANRYSTDEIVFSKQYENLTLGCMSYFEKLGEPFPYNHKTFKNVLFEGFDELGIDYKKIRRNGLLLVEGIAWRDEVFEADFESLTQKGCGSTTLVKKKRGKDES